MSACDELAWRLLFTDLGVSQHAHMNCAAVGLYNPDTFVASANHRQHVRGGLVEPGRGAHELGCEARGARGVHTGGVEPPLAAGEGVAELHVDAQALAAHAAFQTPLGMMPHWDGFKQTQLS